MGDREQFETDRQQWIRELGDADELRRQANEWLSLSCRYHYSYNFDWLGLPIIQFPQDIVAMQEIIWRTKPDLIVETGIARGGSLVFHASMLKLLGRGSVVGVDIDIRPHNREAIESHPLSSSIRLVQGSSVDEEVVAEVQEIARSASNVMVVLDSNHTHEHVLAELHAYSPLVHKGGYIVVLDTVIADMPDDSFEDRPWSKERNPKTAVREFLDGNPRFVVDRRIEDKLQLTVAPEGYLLCVED